MGRPAKIHLGDLGEVLCNRRGAGERRFSVPEWERVPPEKRCGDCSKVLESAARKLRSIMAL